jgi:hypothetical protein
LIDTLFIILKGLPMPFSNKMTHTNSLYSRGVEIS